MINSDSLHSLIHSLSKTEKRYFKQFALLHVKGEKNNYIRLFDAINKQDNYNESLIKKNIKNKSFLNRFSSEKVYLFNLIMKSLRNYRAENTFQLKMYNYMSDLEILYQKGLFDVYKKKLKAVKKIALHYENYPLLLDISDKERQLLTEKETSSPDPINRYAYLMKERIDYIRKIQLNTNYIFFTDQLFLTYQSDPSLKRKDFQKKVKDIFSQNALQNETNATTYISRKAFLNSYGLYNVMIKDYETSLLYYGKLLVWIEKHPDQLVLRTKDYIFAINNFVANCFLLKKYKAAESVIEKIKLIKSKTTDNDLRLLLFKRVYTYELFILNELGKFEQIISLSHTIEKERLSLRKTGSETDIFFLYSYALAHFATNQFKDALASLNKILNSNKYNYARKDILIDSNILLLIVHFELKNYDYLEYAIESCYRLLYKTEVESNTEKIVLNFLRKIIRSYNIKMFPKAYADLKTELLHIKNESREKKLPFSFDIIAWLESKIQNRSFAEVVKENAKLNAK